MAHIATPAVQRLAYEIFEHADTSIVLDLSRFGGLISCPAGFTPDSGRPRRSLQDRLAGKRSGANALMLLS
jgi:hypothetical protein